MRPNFNMNCGRAPNFPRCMRMQVVSPHAVRLCRIHGMSYEAVHDSRARLSKLWVPTGGIAAGAHEDSHAMLLRAGFLRQAYPGIFHLMPLGRRVLNKLENLIDKHMYKLGASKIELSSISSEELWSKSGRLQSGSSELFHFQDRKEVPYLLSPTHEEEVTSLVMKAVKSYKDLPVLLYQVSRKYRDELRPRHGLLRSREFVMKDLYTFDISSTKALATYHKVRNAYVDLFMELKLPFLVAEADSGDIGGDLSHEFHFPSARGEDRLISCSHCEYVANEEVARATLPSPGLFVDSQSVSGETTDTAAMDSSSGNFRVWRGISKDRLALVNVWFPPSDNDTNEVNTHAVKAVLPSLDSSVADSTQICISSSTGGLQPQVKKIVNLVDGRLPAHVLTAIENSEPSLPFWPSRSPPPSNLPMEHLSLDPSTGGPLNLLRIKEGDRCSQCKEGTLKAQKTIEVGHTFHLGTRYSEPMEAVVSVPLGALTTDVEEAGRNTAGKVSDRQMPFQMGCHGIGVSRIMGAVADTLADQKGLNWPRLIAPFEAIIIPIKGLETAAIEVYDILSRKDTEKACEIPDLLLDDRQLSFPWKARDADLIGYPIIIIVGRRWQIDRTCEVQCRRLGLRIDVEISDLSQFLVSTLIKL